MLCTMSLSATNTKFCIVTLVFSFCSKHELLIIILEELFFMGEIMCKLSSSSNRYRYMYIQINKYREREMTTVD